MASEPNISTVWEANRGRSQSPPVFATIAVTYGLRIQAYRLPFICDCKLMILRATSKFICWILPSTYKALPHAVASKASAPFNSLEGSRLRSQGRRPPCRRTSFDLAPPRPGLGRTRGEGQGVRGFALCFDWFFDLEFNVYLRFLSLNK